MTTLFGRMRRRIFRMRYMSGKHLRHRSRYLQQVAGKDGIEIGGPSEVFRPGSPLDLYGQVGHLDNCNFSPSTVWESHQEAEYPFDPGKPPGRSIFCEGSDLAGVPDASYDFVLSSHNLEHLANPVKALAEWKRILRPRGALVLVLPDYRRTFDHRRTPTSVDHMMDDYARNIGEDDLTHLPEILERHDLALDPGAGTAEAFRERSQNNLTNRCLHHHVFDQRNSRQLLERAGYHVRSVDLAAPCHLILLATL